MLNSKYNKVWEPEPVMTNLNGSGITQHHEHCTQLINMDNFKPVHNMQGKKKRKLGYDLRIREAMEIRHYDCGPGKGLNEDTGAYIKTDIWDPVLRAL